LKVTPVYDPNPVKKEKTEKGETATKKKVVKKTPATKKKTTAKK
jgi:hypothetical protein